MSNVYLSKDMFAPAAESSLRHLLDRVHSLRDGGMLVSYGKNSINLGTIVQHPLYATSQEESENYARFVIQAYKHAQYILDNPDKFLPIVNNKAEKVVIKHAGIQSEWKKNSLGWIRFKPEAVDKLLEGKFTQLDRSLNGNYNANPSKTLWVSTTNRFSQEYLGDSNTPLLMRTLWLSRLTALKRVLRYTEVYLVDGIDKRLPALYVPSQTVSLSEIVTFREIATLLSTQSKLSRDEFAVLRQEVLNVQTLQTKRADEERRAMSAKNFEKFWDKMKTAKRAVKQPLAQALEDWNTIPLLATNTTSSRTWGIEVETVRAQETHTPRGWRSVYDGSLPDSSGCNCGCDDCYEAECCGGDECEVDGESTEFVSPVLRHFNSSGLLSICNDLGADEYSSAPGVHVHVGADNLSVSDVSRLLFAYGVTSPLFESLYFRKERGYCKDTASQRVSYWLSASRKIARGDYSIDTISEVTSGQPGDRYYDVNLESINKHGTIEFRAMGPRYDYMHLVRWAWFCREMVNVSKLGLPQDVWTSCSTLADVIKVLRTYGSEASYADKSDYTEVTSNNLVLTEQ